MIRKRFFVIIPIYNEQKHILQLLKKVRLYSENIIVVNDGSTDRSLKILKEIPYIKVINLSRNQGKGAAMRHGAKLAWKLKAEGIIFIDGDNQHDPGHLPTFFKNLKDGHDLVIGVRILKVSVPLYRKFGNICLINTIKLLFNISLPDLLCGYRGMSKKGYYQVKWTSNDYGVETEMIALIGLKKISFKTIIVETIYLDKYKGFSIKDGVAILCKLPLWKITKTMEYHHRRRLSERIAPSFLFNALNRLFKIV